MHISSNLLRFSAKTVHSTGLSSWTLVLRACLGILLCTLVSACSSTEHNLETPEGAFAYAQDLDKDGRYLEASKRYQEVRNKFPYSRFATQAELALADVYFKQEEFAEAQLAYQTFQDLHPKHPQADYVLFRIGLSYFRQLPPTIDRDLSLANQALKYFDEFLSRYPNSELNAEARDLRAKTQSMLEQKERYIADWYFKRKLFESALGRYQDLLKKFPGSEHQAHALSRAALSAIRSGNRTLAMNLLAELSREFPGSREEALAKKELE